MSDRIEPVDFSLKRTNLAIPVTCGSCRHFKGTPAPGFKQTCYNMCVIEEQKPCYRFAVAPSAVKFAESVWMRLLANICRRLNRKQLLAMASLLVQESKTRRHGVRLGQTVYFLAYGGDFLANYRKGYIVSADPEHMTICGRNRGDDFTVNLKHESVLTADKWQVKRNELLAAKLIIDPTFPTHVNRASLVDYVPPTIDHAPAEETKPKSKKRSKSTFSVTRKLTPNRESHVRLR